MYRRPAEFLPGLGATQPLVAGIAPRPFTKFLGYSIFRNDIDDWSGNAHAARDRSGNLADGNAFRGNPEIGRLRRGALERKGIEVGEIVAMDEWPTHSLTADHANRSAFADILLEASEHAAVAAMDHRRMDDDAVDACALKNMLQVRHHPGKSRQR